MSCTFRFLFPPHQSLSSSLYDILMQRRFCCLRVVCVLHRRWPNHVISFLQVEYCKSHSRRAKRGLNKSLCNPPNFLLLMIVYKLKAERHSWMLSELWCFCGWSFFFVTTFFSFLFISFPKEIIWQNLSNPPAQLPSSCSHNFFPCSHYCSHCLILRMWFFFDCLQ